MTRRILIVILSLNLIYSLVACKEDGQQDAVPLDISENSSYESVKGTQIKMITENTEVIPLDMEPSMEQGLGSLAIFSEILL